MASRQPPFFYHILMNPSSPHLPLPAKFVKKHLRNKILKDPILKSANGGYSWKLKMKKFDDDHSFCFVNGWSKVVKDVGLLFGEFLLFRYVGYSVFSMHVYSVNGCEKILVPKTKVPRINKVDVSVEDEVVFDDDDDVEDEVEDDDDDDDAEYGVRDDVEEEDEDVEDEEDDDVDEDDDDVEFGDDGDEDDGDDEDVDVDVDGNDGDPFFIMTSSKRNKYKLRFPPELVALTKINNKETITLKNDDGYEKEMPVRSYKQNKLKRYYVTEGWKEFQRSNDISEGDECVFKFITSEDKLCLAKVTKKKSRATEVDNDDMDDDDSMDEEGKAEAAKDDDFIVDGDDIFDDDGMDEEGEGEDVKLVDNDDEDDSVDGDEGNPSFIMTSSNTNQYKLPFPADFVALVGINTKETITLKNLDGYEKDFPVRLNKQYSRTCYYLGAGWKEFQRNTNISKGDKFVVKFITSEDKFCLAKVTKKRTLARPPPPAAEAPVTEVDDGIDDKDVDDNDVKDVDEDVERVDDEGNPSFVATITPTYNRVLRMPSDFGRLAGFDTNKKTLTLKGLDGYEKEMPLRVDQKRYYVGMGWKDILQSTSVSEGDKCVFKFIASEDKLCLAKIIKKETQARPQLPAAEAQETEFNYDDVEDDNDKDENEDVERVDDCIDDDDDNDKDENEDVEPVDDVDPFFVVNITTTHKHMLRLPPEFVELAGIDGKKNIIIKCLDGNEMQMVLRRVKQGHLPRYCLSMGWQAFKRSNNISEGDVYVFKYIRSEDKMCLEKITKKETRARPTPPAAETLTTEVDDDDLKVDGIDDKDVEVNDNKVDDENVELVDDGMDNKDVNGDDNRDEDENIELVDYGMDVDAEDNKDEDKGAEFVDGNPFFVVTITPGLKCKLRLPTDFVALAGIESKENIIMKSLDRNETQMPIRTEKQHRSTQYHLSVGWPAFKRSNNISEGDECVFKYIRSEDKMCLEKITKKETRARPTPPAAETLTTEVDDDDLKVDGIDDKDAEVNDNKVDDENVELVDDGMDDKDVNGDDNKDEDENVELVDDGMDVDAEDNKDEDKGAEFVDGNPFFVVTITPGHKCKLHLPTDFVALAGIESKENIIMKSLDRNETQMPIRTEKQHRSTQYHLSVGWPAFKRSNNISEGDECVFKYIRSEDKMCLEKITKKETRARPTPPAAETLTTEVDDDDLKVDGIDDKDAEVNDNKVDDENVELVDDGMDDKDVNGDDNKDEDENVELVDDGMDVDAEDNKDEDKGAEFVDGNPFFVVTITPGHKCKLHLPTDFVALAGIESKENIIMKSLDRNETQMPIRTEKQHRSTQYHLSVGWPAFKRSNNISEGDECVFKYITSEDKMCLAKIIKTSATEVDADPCFVVTVTPCHKALLRLPTDFVALAGIESKENIIMKSLDENETQMSIRTDKRFRLTQYHLSVGWPAFKQSNNISEGDECVFKYITSEDKMCLAKVTKEKTSARPPLLTVRTPPTEVDDNDLNVDDGMDGKDVVVDDNKDEDENVELVDDGMDDKDVNGDDNKDEDENVELADNGIDVDADDNKDEDKDVELLDDGMDDKDVNGDDNKDDDENVELVDDGMDDKDVVVDDNKDEDENVELVDGMDGKYVVVDDNKDEDENVELVDDGMDGKDVVVDDNKDEDENVELVDDGMDGKEVVVDDNKDEDENVELVDDGMDGKDVVVDDNKDEDENVELVDNGMDGKDVVVDDNKDEDENVELVDNGMDGKDVVVDDNKDEDENVELADNGMDGKDVVVDDNKDKDENVKLVDNGMDGKDVVVDDNKDEDVNVELVDDGMDEKDVNGDDSKDEDENVELVDDGMDVDANDNKDEDNDVEHVDGNPFFVVTITPSHKLMLRLPPYFVELAGIDGKKNIIIKCPDRSERQMVLRSVKQGHLTRYCLSMGWSAFRRSNDISEGDECVFKYITSEDKMCLAKITKKETRARSPPPATETPPTGVDDSMDDEYAEVDDNKDKDENVELVDDGMDDNDVDEYVKLVDGMDDKDMEFDNKNEGDENENVELLDDGMDDKDVDEYVKLIDGTDNKDRDDNVELVDDRDPFFRVTITPNHKSILRLPPDFVGLAGINTKKNIIVKSLDGNESQMAVWSDKRFNSLQYHLAQGWVAFTQRNNLSQGDECVFKYITSEDKMCLAKVIKTSATEVDADPYFVVTITPCHKSMLWLPTDFVGLAGIDTKENIRVKSLDGNETQMALRLCPGKKNQLIRYRLTMGWPAFKRSNNILEGDECLFKYITSEDKMCLAKVTKEKTQTRLPSPAEVVKRKRGWLPPVTAIKMTAAETVKMRSRRPPPVEITVAEAVKRKRGQPPPSSPRVTKDMKRKKGPRPHVHSADVEGVDEGVEVKKKPRGRPSK